MLSAEDHTKLARLSNLIAALDKQREEIYAKVDSIQALAKLRTFKAIVRFRDGTKAAGGEAKCSVALAREIVTKMGRQ